MNHDNAANNQRRDDILRQLLNITTHTSNNTILAALYRSLLLQRSSIELPNFPSSILPPGGSNTTNRNPPATMRHDASLSHFLGNHPRNDAESFAALQSMLLSSSTTNNNSTIAPNSLPFLRHFEPMNQSSNTNTSVQLLQQQQQQAEFIARYQQQQQLQQQQLRNQQQQQLQQQQLHMLDSNAANRLFPSNSLQDTIFLQQQQGRGDDRLLNNPNNFASSFIRSQQQQQQTELLQQQLAASNPQLQQQRFMMNDALLSESIEQLQHRQQQRRRSSMSSGVGSISPMMGSSDRQQVTGVRPLISSQLSFGMSGNNTAGSDQLFGSGMTGTLSDFARFSNTAPMIRQQSFLPSLSNPSRFNNNMTNTLGNRPSSYLSSATSLLHPDELAIINTADAELARRDGKKRCRTFPEKLMAAMMDHEDERAVAWLPDGKSFVIVNPDIFVNEVLHGGFKQTKYASFVRKLHRWGFTRLTSGTGTDCFHHPHFNRNFPDWSSRITCVPMKEAAAAAAAAKDLPTTVDRTTSAVATKSKSIKEFAAKVTDAVNDAAALDREMIVKPPSLAGVERFIRGKSLDSVEPTSSSVTGGNVVGPSKPTDKVAGNRLQLIPIESTTVSDEHQEDAAGEQSGPTATI